MLFVPGQIPGSEITTYPVLAAGATCTAGAANTYGAAVELAAAGVVTVPKRVVSVCIRTPSAAQTGKIQIVHTTAGPVNVAELDYEIASDAGGFLNIPVLGSLVIPAGVNVGARIKTTAGAQTVDVSVGLQNA